MHHTGIEAWDDRRYQKIQTKVDAGVPRTIKTYQQSGFDHQKKYKLRS